MLDAADWPALVVQTVERVRHLDCVVSVVVPDDDAAASDQSAREPALVQHRCLAVIAIAEHRVARLKVSSAERLRFLGQQKETRIMCRVAARADRDFGTLAFERRLVIGRHVDADVAFKRRHVLEQARCRDARVAAELNHYLRRHAVDQRGQDCRLAFVEVPAERAAKRHRSEFSRCVSPQERSTNRQPWPDGKA